MKKTVLALSFAVLCAVSLMTVSLSSADETKDYRSSSVNNFTISYPSTWEIKEMSNAVIFLSPLESATDTFRENVNVYVEDLSKKPMSLEKYMEITETNGPKLIKGFKVLEKSFSNIAYEDAQLTVYEGEVNNILMKFRAYTVIKNNKAYNLTYTSYPNTYNKFLADAEKVVQSILLK